DFLKNSCKLSMTTSPKKTIPITIMTGTKEVVRSFLQGLFDTDGSITAGQFEYSTASRKLAKQVHLLLLNFGIVSKLREKTVKGRPYYIISIYNYPMLKLFSEQVGFKLAVNKQKLLTTLT